MRGTMRMMGQRLGVIGVALTLSLAGVALGGCGSSGGGEASDATAQEESETAADEESEGAEADAQAEGDAENEVLQWFQTSYRATMQSDEQSWVSPGETYQSKHDSQITYEVDEHGNTTKQTSVSSYSSEGYDSVTEEVREYTYDEKGWPVSIDITTTEKSYSVGYESVEEYDEDGNLVESYRPIDDGGSLENAEPQEETEKVTFTYEHDDEGRVTKASADDQSYGAIEVTYHDNGKVASFKQTNSYDSYTSEGEGTTHTYSYETWYDEKGKAIGYTDTEVDENGTTETVTECDENGNATKETITVTDPDGTKHELVKTYDLEKDDKGNAIKSTCTVSGDGEGECTRWVNGNQQVVESFTSDGGVSASVVTYDENYNEVVGEPTTYEGPYSVSERTFDDDGNMLTIKTDYYDGTSTKAENTYDKDGNITKTVNEAADGTVSTTENAYDEEGNTLSSTTEQQGGSNQRNEYTYEYVFVEEPSEYAGMFRQYTWW